MKQQTLEQFEYSETDIEKLIYEDICKHCPKTLRQRVNICFKYGSDQSALDDERYGSRILKGAYVTVDVTK